MFSSTHSFTLKVFVTVILILLFNCFNCIAELQDRELLWGPYRSNLYFGLRARVPQSISLGLMWTRIDNNQVDVQRLRHTCEEDDEITESGWEYYDVRHGGVNKINDLGNRMNLTMEFLKYDASGVRGSWTARITARSLSTYGFASTILYITSDQSSNITCNATQITRQHNQPIVFSGSDTELGSFKIYVEAGSNFRQNTKLSGLKVPEETLWKAKGILKSSYSRQIWDYHCSVEV
jgi:mannosyl-oligosaccharide glucosidase